MKPIEQIDKELRQAIIAAVPEITETVVGIGEINGHKVGYDRIVRPITLADVLQAMKRKLGPISYHNELPKLLSEGSWSLSQPLDGQSEECLRFLHSVICK